MSVRTMTARLPAAGQDTGFIVNLRTERNVQVQVPVDVRSALGAGEMMLSATVHI